VKKNQKFSIKYQEGLPKTRISAEGFHRFPSASMNSTGPTRWLRGITIYRPLCFKYYIYISNLNLYHPSINQSKSSFFIYIYSIYIYFFYLSLSIYLSLHLYLYLYIYISISTSISISISIYLSIFLIYLSIYLI
jgi:hypothetical protein